MERKDENMSELRSVSLSVIAKDSFPHGLPGRGGLFYLPAMQIYQPADGVSQGVLFETGGCMRQAKVLKP